MQESCNSSRPLCICSKNMTTDQLLRHRYINENLHRYTPKRELEAELRRKQARGGQKEGKA